MRMATTHSTKLTIRCAAIVMALTASIAGTLWAGNRSKIASDLRTGSAELVDVIVQFTQPPQDKHHKKVLKKVGFTRRT